MSIICEVFNYEYLSWRQNLIALQWSIMTLNDLYHFRDIVQCTRESAQFIDNKICITKKQSQMNPWSLFSPNPLGARQSQLAFDRYLFIKNIRNLINFLKVFEI